MEPRVHRPVDTSRGFPLRAALVAEVGNRAAEVADFAGVAGPAGYLAQIRAAAVGPQHAGSLRCHLRTAEKTRLFDAYARRSAVAESASDAVDVSDTELTRRIVEEEQARLGMTDEGLTASG